MFSRKLEMGGTIQVQGISDTSVEITFMSAGTSGAFVTLFLSKGEILHLRTIFDQFLPTELQISSLINPTT